MDTSEIAAVRCHVTRELAAADRRRRRNLARPGEDERHRFSEVAPSPGNWADVEMVG